MLKLSLLPEEYVTIGGGIVVLVDRVVGNRVHLVIEAPREVPILRGTVLERDGAARPACLNRLSSGPANRRK